MAAEIAQLRAILKDVPRTDENGRNFKALLDYLLNGEAATHDIFEAIGISSSTYYRRIREDDYPNAEELRKVAERFQLSFFDLQVRFGLISREEIERYCQSLSFTLQPATLAVTARRPDSHPQPEWDDGTPPL